MGRLWMDKCSEILPYIQTGVNKQEVTKTIKTCGIRQRWKPKRLD
jgi:hypothetical protein